MRISDWSSDVCSSDLMPIAVARHRGVVPAARPRVRVRVGASRRLCMDDRYGADVLAKGWRDVGRRVVPQVPAERDLVVEVAADGYCGAVTTVASGTVELEACHGRRRR